MAGWLLHLILSWAASKDNCHMYHICFPIFPIYNNMYVCMYVYIYIQILIISSNGFLLAMCEKHAPEAQWMENFDPGRSVDLGAASN